jgi:prepilin-type N-terminal cleavage/methylation domain-containing protein
MRRIISPLFSLSSGFTLIELLIVLAVIGLLTGVGINTSIQYNRSQVVDSAAKDFATMLQTAKSRAFTQVKPSNCTGTLSEYRVVLQDDLYSLYAVCATSGAVKVGTDSRLHSGVDMTETQTPISFVVLSNRVVIGGGVANATYTFTGYGFSKTVQVFNDGRIISQ